jgi:hypothetical protein
MRRLFWLGLGLGTGTTIGLLGARWVRRQTRVLAPANLAEQAASAARDVASLLQEAAKEFRRGVEEREAELRPLLDQGAR